MVFVSLLRHRLSECAHRQVDRVSVILLQLAYKVGEKGAKDEQ